MPFRLFILVAHLVFQLLVCYFFGGSWWFVAFACLAVAVAAFLEYRRLGRLASRSLPQLCGSPWSCPICALEASERRRSA